MARKRTREEIIESLYRAATARNSPQLLQQARRMERGDEPPHDAAWLERGESHRRVDLPPSRVPSMVRDVAVGAIGAAMGAYLANRFLSPARENLLALKPSAEQPPTTDGLYAGLLGSAKPPR